MKKIIMTFIVLLLSVQTGYWYTCDRIYKWELRYWYQYSFHDEFINDWDYPIWMYDVLPTFTEEYDFNWSSDFPSFSWLSWFEAQNYTLDLWETWILVESNSNYSVNHYPEVRSENNLVLQFEALYYEKVNWVWSDTLSSHTECKYYEVTRCWDGIVDEDYETCDPNDSYQTGWWTAGCSTTCQAIDEDTTTSTHTNGSHHSSNSSSNNSYCGDGVVQRPNDASENEECDFWSEDDWGACNKTTCKIEWTITFPGDWELVFWPADSLIIWGGMNPYSTYTLDKPSIYNNSDYDFYFDNLCVAKASGSSLVWNTDCREIWEILYAWDSYSFSSYPSFTWNTDGIDAWSYDDNVLVTTIEHDWELFDNAYFASKLNVRVSKPSVWTVWWWTSYLKSTEEIADISSVSDNWELNPDENKNFVWAWVSTWDISSYSVDVTDSESVEEISDEWESYNENSIVDYDIEDTVTTTTTYNISEFENYNWIENAFILTDSNFVVNSSTLDWLSGSRTYVIENGDLIIEDDVDYSDNIAFVVKWGDIEIASTVEEIDWTYISIPKLTTGWDIIWTWWTTTTVLTVNWSLYWNIEELVSQRTYLKQNSSWQLDVWTIVSFGSSIFRDPAPLTSTFIWEYIESTKVAQ